MSSNPTLVFYQFFTDIVAPLRSGYVNGLIDYLVRTIRFLSLK